MLWAPAHPQVRGMSPRVLQEAERRGCGALEGVPSVGTSLSSATSPEDAEKIETDPSKLHSNSRQIQVRAQKVPVTFGFFFFFDHGG